jgi:hypothetical protein
LGRDCCSLSQIRYHGRKELGAIITKMVLRVYRLPTHLVLGERHHIRPGIGAKASASHERPSTSSRRCFQEASRADVPTEKRWKTSSASAMMRSTKIKQDIGLNTSTAVTNEVCAPTTVHSTLHAHPLSPSKQFLYALAVLSQSSDPSPVDVPFPRPFFIKQLPGHLLNTQSRLA